jgi:hypothetical protein
MNLACKFSGYTVQARLLFIVYASNCSRRIPNCNHTPGFAAEATQLTQKRWTYDHGIGLFIDTPFFHLVYRGIYPLQVLKFSEIQKFVNLQ